MSNRQKIELVRVHPSAVLPVRATGKSFGYDLATTEDVTIHPGETKILGTGWKLARELPTVEYMAIGENGQPERDTVGGVALLVLPRSSLFLKHNLLVANSPGLIDADYTGEIGVIVHKPAGTQDSTFLAAGTRIAQLIQMYLDFFPMVEVELAVQSSDRGGFGSTGT